MDHYARPIMWNVPHAAEYFFYALIPVVMILFTVAVVWRVRKWFLGTAEPGTETPLQRLKRIFDLRRLTEWISSAFFQSRLKRDTFALVMHLAIFWGMAVLFIGTALATIDQDFLYLPFGVQMLQGKIYQIFELVLDVFGVVLLVGVGFAAYRRYVIRPPRLTPKKANISKWDAFPFLSLLAAIAVTGFLVEGLRIAEGMQLAERLRTSKAQSVQAKLNVMAELGVDQRIHLGEARRSAELTRIAETNQLFPAAAWAPVGYALGLLFRPLSPGTIQVIHQVLWWLHGLLAFGLILCIPFTKAFHFISSPINLLFRTEAPAGRLVVTAESGVQTVRDYSWRQLLEIDACTWCGKCQEVCPGFNTGFPLSPRDFVHAIGGQLLRTSRKTNGAAARLPGGVVPADELWACCTCRACEDVCPVGIQHPRLIIDQRRHLVDQGQIDEGVQDALMNCQRYGNSFGQSARKRADWSKPLPFSLKDARKEEVEFLWFVGDYASYDQRTQEITRAIAKVFQAAGADVGLLFDKEQNSGNDVRRIGEEGLFALLRAKNFKELGKAKFQAVLTTDPHSYNTLKNEYIGNGGGPGDPEEPSPLIGKPIYHYTELLDRWIAEGRLRVARNRSATVTYHDPCYLGRFNGIYDAPRRVLAALGLTLREMPRCRENSFCCGAGGGRIWMKDTPGIEERPAESRVKEALAVPGVQHLVVACPKDLVMFQDAVKTVGAENRLRVVDLGELVFESLNPAAPSPAASEVNL